MALLGAKKDLEYRLLLRIFCVIEFNSVQTYIFQQIKSPIGWNSTYLPICNFSNNNSFDLLCDTEWIKLEQATICTFIFDH